jgi:predicted dehydrogenase
MGRNAYPTGDRWVHRGGSEVTPSLYTSRTMTTPRAAPELPFRTAVIGTGGISKEHLSFLSGRTATVSPVDGRVAIVGVCDLSKVAADYAADEFGADRSYTDVVEMLAQARPDVVHVLTPPQTHVELVTVCLEAGAHVICEKPIAPTSAELEQLLSVAEANGRHLMESHNYRFNRGVIEIKAAIDRGDLGAVREVEIRIALPVTDPAGRFGDLNLPSPIHEMPAGVIHDFTTHFTYLLLHLTGPVEFTRIAAAWSNHSKNPLFRFDDLDALLVGQGPEGPVHGRLRFDAGAAPDAFAVRVSGTRGWTETDLFQPYNRTVLPRSGGSQLSPIINHVVNGAGLMSEGFRNFGRKLLQQSSYEGLHRMLDETYVALAAGRPLPVSTDEMLAASRLVDRLLESEVSL